MSSPVDPNGRTAKQRRERRQAYMEREVALARSRGAAFGRSMKCHGFEFFFPPRHADEDGGCKNDGSNCLCECHDPKAVPDA